MKKFGTIFLFVVLAGGVAVSSSGVAQTLPKQANFDVTYQADVSVLTSIDAGNGQAIIVYQANLRFTNSSNTPLFRDISASCVETEFEGGDSGYCVYFDKDQDTFVETITRPPKSKTGQGVFGSGTGKYTGITGQVSLRSFSATRKPQGRSSYVGKVTGNYKLP
ncbi:hypothetical protein J8I87_40180 [Paraburkholderia sp. LEh10]|uniref:hypothetical protein n=1 Tax=Paraburkholderia sp. LEh10 TaxID=2821353 RepID=UPI001AE2EFCD|nr:hypothetical protein [Paraburkholderia sp. LEh10]MBP0595750.1 hypothetical protein [Paraburkholderia sp. LEh10]